VVCDILHRLHKFLTSDSRRSSLLRRYVAKMDPEITNEVNIVHDTTMEKVESFWMCIVLTCMEKFETCICIFVES